MSATISVGFVCHEFPNKTHFFSQMFLDLNEINLIDFKSIEQGHLIGRGAFGFVFKSFMKSTHSNETKTVAMKILQPVQTGFKSKEVRTAGV